MAWRGGFLTIPIKKKPEFHIASNWLLYFESWSHKLLVLERPLQATFQVSGIFKACIFVTIFMSGSLLASTCILPVIGHSHILEPGNSLFTLVPQDLQVQLHSL